MLKTFIQIVLILTLSLILIFVFYKYFYNESIIESTNDTKNIEIFDKEKNKKRKKMIKIVQFTIYLIKNLILKQYIT